AAAGIAPCSSEVPFYSAVTGERLDTAELDAEYWYRNARQTVRFGPTVERLLAAGLTHFVAVSPNPLLVFPLNEALGRYDGPHPTSYTGTLRRHQGGLDDFGRSLSAAWTAGIEVDWGLPTPAPRRRLALPTYPFQREPFWLQAPGPADGDVAAAGQE